MQFFGVNVDLQTNSDHPVNNYTVTGGFAFFPVDSFPQQIQDEEFNGGVVMLYEEGRAMSQETYTTPGGLTATIVEVAARARCGPPHDGLQRPFFHQRHPVPGGGAALLRGHDRGGGCGFR